MRRSRNFVQVCDRTWSVRLPVGFTAARLSSHTEHHRRASQPCLPSYSPVSRMKMRNFSLISSTPSRERTTVKAPSHNEQGSVFDTDYETDTNIHGLLHVLRRASKLLRRNKIRFQLPSLG